MEIIDSHCHLQFDDYNKDRESVIKSSIGAKVNRIINVGTSLTDSRKAVDLANSRNGFWATAGVHPHGASSFVTDDNSLTELKKLLRLPKIVAVGEVGLDFYRDRSPRDAQENALRTQIEAGLELDLPFVFHIRESFSGFWPIFDEFSTAKKPIRGVIHSFSAPPSELDRVLARNLHIGLNGLLTYTKEKSWLESAKQVPLKNLLLETDAPFLTPVPDRGKRCEPRHTAVVAQFLASLRNEPVENIVNAATCSTVELFNLSTEEKLI